MNGTLAAGLLITLVLIVGVICYGAWIITSYHRQVGWVIDQGVEWLWRARASNDPKFIAQYINESLKVFEPLHGNPAWWYPKPDTSWDLIKDNLIEMRDQLLAHNNTDAMATQQLVHNTQETIVEIQEHIKLAENSQKDWGSLTRVGEQRVPSFFAMNLVLAILFCIFIIVGPLLIVIGAEEY